MLHNYCPVPLSGGTSNPHHSRQTLLLRAGSWNLVVERQEWGSRSSEFLCCGTLSINPVWSPSYRGCAEQDHVCVSQMTRKGKLICSFFFFELKGFTTETYSYNANITQPEQRNKPPNTTTDLPQQTVVNRKPQQWEGESHGGLHGYMITKKSEHGNTMTTTNKQPRTRQAQEQTHRHTSPAEMMATACKQLHHL